MILLSLTTLFSELFYFLMFLWPNVVMKHCWSKDLLSTFLRLTLLLLLFVLLA
jgi:hypothetical protein